MRNMILGLWLTMPFGLFAQASTSWEMGAGMGIAAYNGETNKVQLKAPVFGINPAFSVIFRKNMRKPFAARINLLYSRLSGNDDHFNEPAWHKTRGISFSSPLLELSGMAEFYPRRSGKNYRQNSGGQLDSKPRIDPFLAFGLGATFTNPSVFWNDANANEYLDPVLAKFDKDHTQRIDFSIPLGFGIRFNLNKQLGLLIEACARPAVGDYLDGISVSGNPNQNDWFVSTQVCASYTLGKGRIKPQRKHQGNQKDEKPIAPDQDEDGIPDERDECPDKPGVRSLFGCPDQDHDGVADKDDLCPEAPGLYALNGCPDLDADGIADKDDNCPEVKGVAAYRGCPAIDRDKDGVADAEDLCPDMSGKLQWKGCPDSDGDGIPDNRDYCPGIAGPERLRGCPDTDGDGISDKEDACPTLPGTSELKGCPEAMPAAVGVPYKAVYFGSTLQDWYNTSVTTLNEVIVILNSDPALFARIEGHTDNTGKEPANDLLAEKRAKKCLDYLVSKGIDTKRLNFVGYGSQKPIVPNDTRENRQLNRRVEIYFYKKL
jgi:OOP family OmpA-OmpF porin